MDKLGLELPSLLVLRGQRVILASESQRRSQILRQIIPWLEVIPSNVAEDLPKTLDPATYVMQTAVKKCQEVYTREIDREYTTELASKVPLGLVVAADTIIVSVDGEIIEKPGTVPANIAMLKTLRDARHTFHDDSSMGVESNFNVKRQPTKAWHSVYTGIAIMRPLDSAVDPGYALETDFNVTRVYFNDSVTDELITAYANTHEGLDKSGGYAIQGLGTILIDKIVGSWDNVIGLPLRTTLDLMDRVILQSSDDSISDTSHNSH